MEERKEIVRNVVSSGLKVSKAVSIAGLGKSTYYYRPSGGRKGIAPSTVTPWKGKLVSNDEVVRRIKKILSGEFIDYGYHRTTAKLKQYGYYINHKKVYRLMDENGLLLNKIPVKKLKKQYVKFTSPRATYPFEVIEVDIKYIYLHGERRNVYLVTLFDVFSRLAIEWKLNETMKASEIAGLIDGLVDNWLIPIGLDPKQIKILIRSDNGPQFIAQLFVDKLNGYNIDNEYIRPATPQQNGHIESFHNTINNLICSKYMFENMDEARTLFGRFFRTYNSIRIMKSTLYLSPLNFLIQWYKGKIGVEIKNNKIKYYFREKPDDKAPGLPPEVLLGLKNKYKKENNPIFTNL